MKLKNYPQTFETERLLCRPLNLDDMLAWGEFLADERSTEHFPAEVKGSNPLRALHWVEKQIRRYRDQQGGLMALIEKESGQFVGQAGLIIQIVDGVDELEVGYSLLSRFSGKGYATEAAIAFKNLGFAISDAPSIVSNIAVANTESQRVALRNGMIKSRQTKWRDLDIFVYRILRENHV